MKKERKEREKEEMRRSRQRASSESGSELAPAFPDHYGEASAAAKTTHVPSLSLSTEGGGLEIQSAADSTKSPSTFLLDQITTMLALMNGHHEHEVARLSLDGLLDILSRVLPPPSLSFFISFFLFLK